MGRAPLAGTDQHSLFRQVGQVFQGLTLAHSAQTLIFPLCDLSVFGDVSKGLLLPSVDLDITRTTHDLRRLCDAFARLASAASAWVNLWSAYRRKISPRTGVENSDGLRLEFAHNWSAAAQSRLSMSLLVVISLLPRYVWSVFAGESVAKPPHLTIPPEI